MAQAFLYCPVDGREFGKEEASCLKCGFLRFSTPKVIDKSLPPWKKILYEQQPFEDNYVDPSFLNSLTANENRARMNYLVVLVKMLPVMQHVCLLILYISSWWQIKNKVLRIRDILFIDFTVLAVGLITSLREVGPKDIWRKTGRIILSTVPAVIALWLLSPVFLSLTAAVSSDTICVMASFLFLIHLFLHDYAIPSTSEVERLVPPAILQFFADSPLQSHTPPIAPHPTITPTPDQPLSGPGYHLNPAHPPIISSSLGRKLLRAGAFLANRPPFKASPAHGRIDYGQVLQDCTANPPSKQSEALYASSRNLADPVQGPSPVSLNAAVMASLLLASRLEEATGVFALMLIGMFLFVSNSVVRLAEEAKKDKAERMRAARRLETNKQATLSAADADQRGALQTTLTLPKVVLGLPMVYFACLITLGMIHKPLMHLVAVVVPLVTLGGPWLYLVCVRVAKYSVRGPWDTAHVRAEDRD